MIYVDPLVQHSDSAYHGESADMARCVGANNAHLWCHLFTDGDEAELHAFAQLLGLKRAWFQPDRHGGHYDLTPGKRTRALYFGAKALTRSEAVAVWRAQREKLRTLCACGHPAHAGACGAQVVSHHVHSFTRNEDVMRPCGCLRRAPVSGPKTGVTPGNP